nr:HAD-IIIA family hydrolase [uncultured Roseateles sp.]
MTSLPGTCNVAILAGGMGTRLRSRTGNLPKPMAPILGKPVLEHLIGLCARHGFRDIALLVHYEHETIRAHFGDGEQFGVRLHYCVETDARGTAGALRDALDRMDDRFLVLYGDTYADVNLRSFWNAHLDGDADTTLLLHPNDHPQDSDLMGVDADGRIVAVHPYPHPEGSTLSNLVNAALYAMNRTGLAEVIPAEGRFDLAKHTFPAMLDAGRRLQSYVTPEYIKDMGTPERLDKVERDIVVGLPERLSDRQPRRAVFLDRDGTLNQEVNHLSSAAQLVLLDGAGEAVRRLNRSGTLAVCITNQPVLARGDVTEDGMRAIHARLDQLLGEKHAYLDGLYLCPHHPDLGFPGEVASLKIRCDCRKPATGLIDRAVRDMRISRRDSWMIGDTTSDIRAGRDAGLRTILVRSGHAGRDRKYDDAPDYVLPDLAAAVAWVLEDHARLLAALLPALPSALMARVVLLGGPARAGKTSAAQALREHLQALGRTAHVVSLDGWLRPVEHRPEGTGVLQRYKLDAARAEIEELRDSKGRLDRRLPVYDRDERRAVEGPTVSIGPADLLIVEGVPALMDDRLRALADLRLFIDVDDVQRQDRLARDYAWRGDDPESLRERLASRERDEVPAVRASEAHADFRIQIAHTQQS